MDGNNSRPAIPIPFQFTHNYQQFGTRNQSGSSSIPYSGAQDNFSSNYCVEERIREDSREVYEQHDVSPVVAVPQLQEFRVNFVMQPINVIPVVVVSDSSDDEILEVKLNQITNYT